MTRPRTRHSTTAATTALAASIITTGLTAGVFVDWSNAVLPGLREVDDRTFVTSFQALDAAIVNPLFTGVLFTGSLVCTGLALLLHLRPVPRPALGWFGLALAGCVATWAITFGIHEPLNQTVRTLGELAGDADFAAARAELDETRWTAWNTVRAATSTFAFGCLTVAAVLRRDRPRPHVDTTGTSARPR